MCQTDKDFLEERLNQLYLRYAEELIPKPKDRDYREIDSINRAIKKITEWLFFHG